MNILYLGYFCNDELFDELVKKGSKGSHARQQLEKKLLNGIIENIDKETLEIISYLPETKEVHYEVGESEVYREIKIKYLWCAKNSLTSVVRSLLKNISLIRKWAKDSDTNIVLTYSANPLHIIPAFLLRRIYRYKVVTLCSEVSVYRRVDGLGFVGRVSKKISALLDNSFDGYIILTKYMNELVNKKNKPYLVMEGIAQSFPLAENKDKVQAVFYAGGLSQDNGLEIMLNGFVRLNNSSLKLWICGDGPMKDIVTDYAAQYENIEYFGVLSNENVQRMEQEALVLIAPRFSENEFTKFSFPSKTIEYMTSGTPVIITRLKGIPEEYFKYAYVLEDETSEGVCELIKKVVNEDRDILKEKGEEARQFVLNNKNYLTQGEKVLRFLKTV